MWIATVGGGVARFDARTLLSTAGIDDELVASGITIAPQPADGRTRVALPVTVAGEHRIEVVSTAGEHVTTLFDEHAATGPLALDFDVSNLAPGGYLLVVRESSRIRVAPLIVTR